jgi:hypothetical protein
LAQVFNDTAIPGIVNLKIQSSCNALGIDISFANGFDPDQVTATIKIETAHGPEILAEDMPLMALLESASWGEGYFNNIRNGIGSQFTEQVEGLIDISRSGAIDFTGGATLTLSLKTSEAGMIFDRIIVDTYSLAITSNVADLHVPVTIESGSTRDIGLDGVSRLILPIDKIASVRVRYAADVVPYEARELKRIARKLNDVVSVDITGATPPIHGFRKYVMLDLVGAKSLSVSPVVGVGAFTIYKTTSYVVK